MSMDDKWNVVVRGDAADFYRTWTGHVIFRVRLKMLPDGTARTHAAWFAPLTVLPILGWLFVMMMFPVLWNQAVNASSPGPG